MQNLEENKILNSLIETHLDACRFYREAAGRTDVPTVEDTLHSLERIHSNIVAELGIAAHRNGAQPEAQEEALQPRIFGTLRENLRPAVVDIAFVGALENAENGCIRVLERALESDDVSSDIKMHVFGAVTALEKTQPHLYALKSLTTSTQHA